jgi:hypothetical protein
MDYKPLDIAGFLSKKNSMDYKPLDIAGFLSKKFHGL